VSRWRQAFDRIGGPDAVTWPAFWISLAASMLGHLATGGEVSASLGVRAFAVVVAQIAMFVPLVILRLTLLRNPPRPRPWVAVAGFIMASMARGVVLTAVLLALDAVDQPLWIYRIFGSIATSGLVLLIVAVVVSSMRAHTRSLESLLRVQRRLSAAQDEIVAEVTDRNEQTLERVKARLAEEMVALDSTQGAGSVSELQRLASDVVRPMSHQLAVSVRMTEIAEPEVDDVHVTPRQVAGQLVTGAPFRPVASGVLMAVIITPAAISLFGTMALLLIVTAVTAVALTSWLANRALSSLLPRVGQAAGLAGVILAAVLAGYLSSAAGALVVRASGQGMEFFVGGGLFVAGILLLLALISAILRQQVAAERDLVVYTERLRWTVVRLRQLQWLQGKAISRALHGPVQAAVTSAALRLDSAVRSGAPTTDLLNQIRTELRSTIDVLDAPEMTAAPLDDSLARITGTWQGICEVVTQAPSDARDLLANDPVTTSTVVDILTEAVSNSVRHGGASRVTASFEVEPPDVIRMTVWDDGAPHSAPGAAGLGTRLLDDCTLRWSRTPGEGGQLLAVLLPCSASGSASGGEPS